ncbi:MAG: peptidylprolyl isomerase [Pseudomonadota bacterium]
MIVVDYLLILTSIWLAIECFAGSTRRVWSALLLCIVSLFAITTYRWQGGAALTFGVLTLLALGVGRILRRQPKSAPRWTAGVSALALAALSIWAIWLFPITHLPDPSGTHAVGTKDFVLTDTSRLGIFAAEPDEPRRLLVRVFYPAESIEGLNPRPYFTPLETEHTAVGLGQLVGLPFFMQYISHVDTNSFVDAPLMTGAADLPTVIYSHGYTSFAGQNTVLFEELASHGYVVYAVHHSHDGSPAVLPDGSVIEMDPALLQSMGATAEAGVSETQRQAFFGESHAIRRSAMIEATSEGAERLTSESAQVWLDDRLFVHDQLATGQVDKAVQKVVAASNFDRTGQMGMSFGGSASGAVCLIDKRCAAGVNLDGGDYHLTPFNNQQPQPFLMLYSDFELIAKQVGVELDHKLDWSFNDYSYERHELAGLSSDIVRIKTKDVAHLGVSDFNLFMRNPVRQTFLGPIDGHLMVQIQNDLVRAFFDTHLRGMGAGFPEAQIAKFEGQIERDQVDDVREWWTQAQPLDKTLQVRFETSKGNIEVAVYPERAPISVQNFLQYVSEGLYNGATFYRAVHKQENNSSIGVIQGGLLAHTMAGDGSEYAAPSVPFAPIPHETTDQIGLTNERGTLAYARLSPGSATSEIFFNMIDNEILDTGKGGPNRDGHGYAVFGRVVSGMRVLEAIQDLPKDGPTQIDMLQGQILSDPVRIEQVYVISRQSQKNISVEKGE